MDHDTTIDLLFFIGLGVVGFLATMLFWKMRFSVFVEEGEFQYGKRKFWTWFFIVWLVLGAIRFLIRQIP